LVTHLITLHAQYADIVNTCFQRSQVFQRALKKAFEEFINKDTRVSKLLANFINDVLTKGNTITLTESLEKTLDNVVFLYGYIQEKDIFERHYQINLSTRLLNGLCESEHQEKTMISKLKTEAGYQWCNKLEGMFKDVASSKDMGSKFKSIWDSEKNCGIDLQVNVCSSGYWPSHSGPLPSFNLPPELAKPCDKFRKFYVDQHSGHKLVWHMEKGKAEVLVHFNPKTARTLVLTTYQMMALLLFNEFKVITFKQLLDVTGVPRNEIAHHILSLVHPKVGVLMKRPMSKELEDSHELKINDTYANKLLRVQVPLMPPVHISQADQENAEAEHLELQRRHQVDAAIVRIMKTRQVLSHQALQMEVVSQLKARFTPKPIQVKKLSML